MTNYFVSYHPGAIEWAAEEGIEIDQRVKHLDVSTIKPGDRVFGTLPVHIAEQVCVRGGRYFHLSMELPLESRRKELSAEMMRHFDARLEAYEVRKIDD